MDSHIVAYYSKSPEETPGGHFHDVIALHEDRSLKFEEAVVKMPDLVKGWFELSKLSITDRIEFTRDYWSLKMSFTSSSEKAINIFFDNLDDIGIFLVQRTFDAPYEAHMIYSLKGNSGFFRGYLPAIESETNRLKASFPDVIFPTDYLAFQEIHNGFSKSTDTGILKIELLKDASERLHQIILAQESLLQVKGEPVDPNELIPFYESFGLPFFQCFWTAWYPEGEMGNVYYSSVANTISCLASKEASIENMSFATFSDWLTFYLETIDA